MLGARKPKEARAAAKRSSWFLSLFQAREEAEAEEKEPDEPRKVRPVCVLRPGETRFLPLSLCCQTGEVFISSDGLTWNTTKPETSANPNPSLVAECTPPEVRDGFTHNAAVWFANGRACVALEEKEPVKQLDVQPLVKVEVLSCEELRAADWNGLNDTYVIISDGEDTFRTPTVKDQRAPKWTSRNVCYVRASQERQQQAAVSFQVWDEDFLKADNLLGTASLPLRELVEECAGRGKVLKRISLRQGALVVALSFNEFSLKRCATQRTRTVHSFHPPVLVENLLPHAVEVRFEQLGEARVVRSGEAFHLYAFPHAGNTVQIRAVGAEDWVDAMRAELVDWGKGGSITCEKSFDKRTTGGGLRLTLCATFWVVNQTDLDLTFGGGTIPPGGVLCRVSVCVCVCGEKKKIETEVTALKPERARAADGVRLHVPDHAKVVGGRFRLVDFGEPLPQAVQPVLLPIPRRAR